MATTNGCNLNGLVLTSGSEPTHPRLRNVNFFFFTASSFRLKCVIKWEKIIDFCFLFLLGKMDDMTVSSCLEVDIS